MVLGLGAAQDEPTAISDLSINDVQTLLATWKLNQAFGKGFQQHQYDGEMLEQLANIPTTEMTTVMHSQFPNVVLPQWMKLQSKIKQVIDDGGVDLAQLDTRIPEQETPSARRNLGAVDNGTFADYSGVAIRQDMAAVTLGREGDVALLRSNTSTLTIHGQKLIILADTVEFSAKNGLIANGTDLVASVKHLLAEVPLMETDIRILKQEMYYALTALNSTCSARDESEYSCDDLSIETDGECIGNVETYQETWTDRSYGLAEAPADLLDTYHTYVKVPLEASPPCSTEGGFLGTLLEDAQVRREGDGFLHLHHTTILYGRVRILSDFILYVWMCVCVCQI